MRIGRKIMLAAIIFLFLIGLGLVFYPQINGCVTSLGQHIEVRSFQNLIGTKGSETASENTEEETEPDLMLEAARAYNEGLITNGQNMNSSEVFAEPQLTLSDYGYDSDVFAVIRIPAIDLEMPVYLGASYENLTKGACVIGQTSLPIGGKSTNSVIAGHRGWQGAAMFKQVPSLQIGDVVTITNMWETLTYVVTEKQTISSSDCAAISIREGEDLLTLFTCDYTTSGIKLRALVICTRQATQE